MGDGQVRHLPFRNMNVNCVLSVLVKFMSNRQALSRNFVESLPWAPSASRRTSRPTEATFTPRLGLPEIPMVLVLHLLMVDELFGRSSTRQFRLVVLSASTRGDPRSRCKRRHRSRRKGRRSSAKSIGHGHAIRVVGSAIERNIVAGDVHCISMETVGRGRNQRRVVSLQPLDHRRHIGTHRGVLPEQLVIEPCLEDAALGCVEVLDVLLPALERVDEILDFLWCASGDKLLCFGSESVAGGYKVGPEVGLGGIVLIRYGHNVGGRGSRPTSNTTTGRHVRKVGVAC